MLKQSVFVNLRIHLCGEYMKLICFLGCIIMTLNGFMTRDIQMNIVQVSLLVHYMQM